MVHTLSEVIAFNSAHPAVALKYGQILAQLSDSIDISPGSADTAQYTASRAQDIVLSRGALDSVYNGTDGQRGTPDDFDALLFSANNGAGTPAKVLETKDVNVDIPSNADTPQGHAQAISSLIEKVAAEAATMVRSAKP